MSDTTTPSLRIQPKLKDTDVGEMVWGGPAFGAIGLGGQALAHLLRVVCSTKMANGRCVVRNLVFRRMLGGLGGRGVWPPLVSP